VGDYLREQATTLNVVPGGALSVLVVVAVAFPATVAPIR
jgi:hypothetical protein